MRQFTLFFLWSAILFTAPNCSFHSQSQHCVTPCSLHTKFQCLINEGSVNIKYQWHWSECSIKPRVRESHNTPEKSRKRRNEKQIIKTQLLSEHGAAATPRPSAGAASRRKTQWLHFHIGSVRDDLCSCKLAAMRLWRLANKTKAQMCCA